MSRKLSGECLCGRVKFSVIENFKTFYQCHCKQCKQLTGTAFASNIFMAEEACWLKSGLKAE